MKKIEDLIKPSHKLFPVKNSNFNAQEKRCAADRLSTYERLAFLLKYSFI